MKNNVSSIGLDKKKSKKLATGLNELLADYQIFYMNLRGFHWNIKGNSFFELHLKFEELYNNVLLKVDEIAERILTLEQTPLHSFADYLQVSEIKELKNTSDGKACVGSILSSLQILIMKQRELLDLSSEAGDEGTNAMMSDYIREEEKLVWMLKSYIS